MCGALALWGLAERAPVGPAGGRVESEWERFLSLGFKCRCGEGEREGGGEGVRAASGQRRGASRRTVGEIGFGGGGKEIRRRRRASVSNATDDNPGGRGRTAGRSTSASAAVIVCVLTAQSLGSAALSASAAVGIAGGPTSQRERGDLVLRL